MDEITYRINTNIDATMMIDGFMEPKNRYQSSWKPDYRETVDKVKAAIDEGRVGDIVDKIWLTPNNRVCNIGQGGLGAESINGLREEFKIGRAHV